MIKEAMLYKKLENDTVECNLCAHHCNIADSKFGFCGVRQNKKGKLYALVYGEIIASHIDPIEKKPLYHFYPKTAAYSVASIGCNFRCGFCQNWQISQLTAEDTPDHGGYTLKPEDLVKEAKRNNCKSIAYTYTEPTIFFEYAYDTAKLAKKENIYNVFVTNGFMTEEALRTIKPYLDACNVDLKFFNDETYKKVCQGSLRPVLDSIKLMKKLGIWTEITTLIVPGLNDSQAELKAIAEFIVSVDKEIPWHISGFRPNYKYLNTAPTTLDALKRAQKIGQEAGLRYVYLGNVTEDVETVCYNCGKLLVKRSGYFIENNSIKDGKCPKCETKISGVWG